MNDIIVNSIGKYFLKVSDNSMPFSGLNFNSSIILKIHILSAQLNKLPIKLIKLVMVSIYLLINNFLEIKIILNE